VHDDFRTPRGIPDALEYQRRTPETTVLYRVVQKNLETFLASARERADAAAPHDPEGKTPPDISTLQRTRHLYFALTSHSPAYAAYPRQT
jgi:hypothetical protein